MRLIGNIKEVNSLSHAEKDRMFQLMTSYFDNMKREIFDRDLSEKQWVILLKDSDIGYIRGFSTQMLISEEVDKISVKALFSGDTIIEKEYWGQTELVKVWGKLVFYLIEKYKDSRLYWFLVSMGYKTYRFLKVYFYEFYPCYNKEFPRFEKMVLDIFAYKKYTLEYNANAGIIHFNHPKEHLKAGVADVTAQRLSDPHIRFFVKKNPLYAQGDELACLAELKEENMKPVLKKNIYGHKLI
ncbi:MAG: hypothetical protein AB1629_06905 [Candidatus Omnitrophota bacterium]